MAAIFNILAPLAYIQHFRDDNNFEAVENEVSELMDILKDIGGRLGNIEYLLCDIDVDTVL